MSVDLQAKADEVQQRGFCVLGQVFNSEECARARTVFSTMIADKGGHTSDQPSVGFHPLFDFGPDLAPFFGKRIVADAMAEVLADDVRLAHNGGAVWSNRYASPILTQWHVHYSWDVPVTGLNRSAPERVLCNIYMDGSNDEVGPLVVLPRGLNDPLDVGGAVDEPWPDELAVNVPPGSAVIFDTALWHCSRRGTNDQPRHLFGGHFQGWRNERPHPEDNNAHQAALEPYVETDPVLRGFIQR